MSTGQLGIRLLEAPENRRDDPRARIYIVDHLNQGDTISRRLEVSNSTDAPADVALYAASAQVQDGAFTFGEGRAANELTGWTTVTPSTVTVPARGTTTPEVTVTIPPDAVGGERYAVVWAEQASPQGSGISTVSRVGIRMYVSVGEGEEPASDFTVDQLTAKRNADGAPVVLAQVTNPGQRALDMSGELTLSDGPGGLSAGPFPATLGTTLGIGERQPVEIVLDPALPAGPWTARITLRSGELERMVEGTLTFPSGDAEQVVDARAVDADDDSGALLLPAIAAALLLAVLGSLLFLLWRRRRQDDDEDAEKALVGQASA